MSNRSRPTSHIIMNTCILPSIGWKWMEYHSQNMQLGFYSILFQIIKTLATWNVIMKNMWHHVARVIYIFHFWLILHLFYWFLQQKPRPSQRRPPDETQNRDFAGIPQSLQSTGQVFLVPKRISCISRFDACEFFCFSPCK